MESTMTPEDFQRELNRCFETHGVLHEMRSHLRYVMISALQAAGGGFPARDSPNSPKTHALFLLVAEFLMVERCHYTLSVLTSEVSGLSRFHAPYLGPNPSLKQKERPMRRFKEVELREILSAVGVLSTADIDHALQDYLDRDPNECFLTCFLNLVPILVAKADMHTAVTREREEIEDSGDVSSSLSEQWVSDVSQVLMSLVQAQPHKLSQVYQSITRSALKEVKRLVEAEKRKQTDVLLTRERRIQEQLSQHEEDMRRRLDEAEEGLRAGRSKVDVELTRRQQQLMDLAKQWREKHETVVNMARQIQDLEKEKKALREELVSTKRDLDQLKQQSAIQKHTVADLKGQIATLKDKLADVLRTNAELVGRIADAQTNAPPSRLESVSFSKLQRDVDTLSDDGVSAMDVSPDQVVTDAWERLKALEDERCRIEQGYLNCKMKCSAEVSDLIPIDCLSTSLLKTHKNSSLSGKFRKPQEKPSQTLKISNCPSVVEEPLLAASSTVSRSKPGSYVCFNDVTTIQPTNRQLKNNNYFKKTRAALSDLQALHLSSSSSNSSVSDGHVPVIPPISAAKWKDDSSSPQDLQRVEVQMEISNLDIKEDIDEDRKPLAKQIIKDDAEDISEIGKDEKDHLHPPIPATRKLLTQNVSEITKADPPKSATSKYDSPQSAIGSLLSHNISETFKDDPLMSSTSKDYPPRSAIGSLLSHNIPETSKDDPPKIAMTNLLDKITNTLHVITENVVKEQAAISKENRSISKENLHHPKSFKASEKTSSLFQETVDNTSINENVRTLKQNKEQTVEHNEQSKTVLQGTEKRKLTPTKDSEPDISRVNISNTFCDSKSSGDHNSLSSTSISVGKASHEDDFWD